MIENLAPLSLDSKNTYQLHRNFEAHFAYKKMCNLGPKNQHFQNKLYIACQTT